MYEIILYDTEDGRCPVQELLDSLEPKLLAKTLRTIIKKHRRHQRQKKNWQRSIKQIMNGGMAMSSYKDYKKRALQNPEVKAEYDALQPEYDIIQAMINARVQQNMTQKDLSAKTGITQADISRIENGTRNPSLSMVKKLAQGLGMQLKLEFVPMPTKNKM